MVMVAGLLAPLLFYDPRPLAGEVRASLFPWPDPESLFWVFVAYTFVIHVPFEELYWRGVVFDAFHDRHPRLVIPANGIFFYLLHALPMVSILGAQGWVLAVPAGASGAVWCWIRVRTGSVWPLLVSHAAVCGAILACVREYFLS